MVRGYKITDSVKTRRIGVACSTFLQLQQKGMEKLNLPEGCVIALEDGTIVQDEEYFQTIQSNALIIFYRPYEKIITGTDLILNALQCVNSTYLRIGSDAAQLLGNKAEELLRLIENTKIPTQLLLRTTPEEDPDWFKNLDTNAKTKEEYMKRKAQDRVRGYFYKFQEDVRKSEIYTSDKKRREVLNDCLNSLKKKLSLDEYFGCYFDRRCAEIDTIDSCSSPKKLKQNGMKSLSYSKNSYCDSSGLFHCDGLWQMNYCHNRNIHVINPYSNRESRIIFSTWNLDHRIEKSRTILPALLSAVKSKSDDSSINSDYIYTLLFTRENLKLVHIVCHDKGSHAVYCDNKQLILPSR